MAQLDAAPIVGAADRPLVNRDVAIFAILTAMYSDDVLAGARRSHWPTPSSVTGADCCRCSTPTTNAHPDGTWGNHLEAFRIINCIDRDDRAAVEELDARPQRCTRRRPGSFPRARSAATCARSCHRRRPTQDRHHRRRVRAGRRDRHDRRSVDPARLDPAHGRCLRGRPARRSSHANHHTGYGLNRCVIDVVNSLPDRPRAPRRRDRPAPDPACATPFMSGSTTGDAAV